jgi:hypothetical protein
MINKKLQKLIQSGVVTVFDVSKITPSKDFDSYDYNLFLSFASQEELDGDYCVSQTFTKIEGHKIQGLEPTVRFANDEEFYIDDKIRRNF